jgi:mannose-1-phosphate guanylyltransferase/phosphomannomutase
MNVASLLKTHKERDGAGTIVLKKFEVKIPYGYVTTNPTTLIKNFSEKPTLQFLANAGFYVFKKKIFDYIPSGKVCSLETDVFPAMIRKGEKIYSYYEDAYWNDVGTMVDFERVNDELLSSAPVKVQQE